MTTSRRVVRAAAGVALALGVASAARAQPAPVTVDWALKQQPRQAGVNVTTPAPDQAARCKVSPIPNPKDPKQPMGYLVTDGNNNPVRQFVSYDGKNFNIVAFYLDGVEAYRETFPPDGAAPFQFRWLGANGTKWGLDRNRDGVVDEWVVISPEEVSQELLKAVTARDPKRLEALMITPENLKTIGLPAGDADRIKARASGAAKRLSDTADALKLSPNAKWLHVEYGVPQARPADSFGGAAEDFTSYKSGTVLVDDGGKNHFMQTGELVQVGRAWKLVDGPAAGVSAPGGTGDTPLVDPAIADLVARLNDLDKNPPSPPTVAALAKFNGGRADVLEQIVAKAAADKKEPWVKMLIDSHAAAAEGGQPNNAHVVRLQQWKQAMERPGGNAAIAAYAAYRLLGAEHAVALANIKKNDELPAVQEKWRAGLEEFVKAHGTSADAPEAAWRLAMAWELSGAKEAEAKAKQWFEYIVKNYATHAHAAKATGALKRLDSEGKPLELAGPTLSNPAQQFNAAVKDKVVVVYYWASWSDSLAEDAKKLDALAKTYGPKGLEIVTVGLDHDAKSATEAAGRTGLPGTHLYAPGGLDGSALAAAYGILAPPHVILAGKDGKVVNRNAAVAGLEDEVKKLIEAK
jgi:thiol-disulfide isomerase/thioredoxin